MNYSNLATDFEEFYIEYKKPEFGNGYGSRPFRSDYGYGYGDGYGSSLVLSSPTSFESGEGLPYQDHYGSGYGLDRDMENLLETESFWKKREKNYY
jgi:hypothetical protein